MLIKWDYPATESKDKQAKRTQKLERAELMSCLAYHCQKRPLQKNITIAKTFSFPAHHIYISTDLRKLYDDFSSLRIDKLITTFKDAVKLRQLMNKEVLSSEITNCELMKQSIWIAKLSIKGTQYIQGDLQELNQCVFNIFELIS